MNENKETREIRAYVMDNRGGLRPYTRDYVQEQLAQARKEQAEKEQREKREKEKRSDAEMQRLGFRAFSDRKAAERDTKPESTAEFRKAWLADFFGQRLTAEQRDAISATGAIPTETLNKIVAAFDASPVLQKVTMLHLPGYVSIPVEDSAAAAAWEDTATDSADSVTHVDLSAYQLIKTIALRADASVLGIDALEDYLAERLVNSMEGALQTAIISGDGTGKPTGIATTVSSTGTFTAAAITKADVLHIMASLPDEYQANATWIMPASVFAEISALASSISWDALSEGPVWDRLLGHDCIVTPDATISSTENVFYGDMKSFYVNMPKTIEIEKDRSVDFRSGNTVFRAICLADGKLTTANSFVRFTRSTI